MDGHRDDLAAGQDSARRASTYRGLTQHSPRSQRGQPATTTPNPALHRAAYSRQVGDASTMREQLGHLARMAARPQVAINIVRFPSIFYPHRLAHSLFLIPETAVK
ncbi:Scr1 family TA system antitoxin-like transcriptional regulator [Actinokineospora fastidiosa]|uniref:Scr1 family TA system antitoxin-like transcriptional regulator n=1 Tax=Actinokineospora fastidiosa TaxID=1816 RepID=UPI003570DA49